MEMNYGGCCFRVKAFKGRNEAPYNYFYKNPANPYFCAPDF